MTKHLFPLVLLSTLLGFGLSLPALAQFEETPPDVLSEDELESITNSQNSPENLSEEGDDVGLPEGNETSTDMDFPISAEDVIILVIDGVANYYVPIELDSSQINDVSIPTYTLDGTTATTDANDEVESGSPVAAEEDVEEESGEMVIYPPADSVEDLTPEDILE